MEIHCVNRIEFANLMHSLTHVYCHSNSMHGVNNFYERLEKVKYYHDRIDIATAQIATNDIAFIKKQTRNYVSNLMCRLSISFMQGIYTESLHTDIHLLFLAFEKGIKNIKK